MEVKAQTTIWRVWVPSGISKFHIQIEKVLTLWPGVLADLGPGTHGFSEAETLLMPVVTQFQGA